MTIKRVEPLSFAKIAGVIYAVIGLFMGALISLFALFGMVFTGAPRGLEQSAVSPLIGAIIGLGAIVVSPILYGVMGFVFALLAAWLYNLVASSVGGIQIEFA